MLYSQDGNGLINMLVQENITNEDIKRIIGDFVIAAGDTVLILSILVNCLILIVVASAADEREVLGSTPGTDKVLLGFSSVRKVQAERFHKILVFQHFFF